MTSAPQLVDKLKPDNRSPSHSLHQKIKNLNEGIDLQQRSEEHSNIYLMIFIIQSNPDKYVTFIWTKPIKLSHRESPPKNNQKMPFYYLHTMELHLNILIIIHVCNMEGNLQSNLIPCQVDQYTKSKAIGAGKVLPQQKSGIMPLYVYHYSLFQKHTQTHITCI